VIAITAERGMNTADAAAVPVLARISATLRYCRDRGLLWRILWETAADSIRAVTADRRQMGRRAAVEEISKSWILSDTYLSD
jgi:hypothetical protein